MNTPPLEEAGASSSAIDKDAWVWVRRLASDDVTQWDIQAVKRWLQSNPAHQAAFEKAKRQWQLMKPAIGELLKARPAVVSYHRRVLTAPLPSRRMFLGAVAGVAAAGAAAAILNPPNRMWPSPREWTADDRTATGEQRSLTLSNAVTVTLNTQTSIRRRNASDRVAGIDLITGEAAIDLPASSGRPFSVTAGAVRSVASAGRFEVRYLHQRVCVTCIDGTVTVGHPGGSQVLKVREQVLFDGGATGAVSRIDPDEVSAWRKGELWFERTPLVQVIDEINRYRPGLVVLMAQRDSGVSGRFQLSALDGALLQIQHSFDLSARRLPGGILILG